LKKKLHLASFGNVIQKKLEQQNTTERIG